MVVLLRMIVLHFRDKGHYVKRKTLRWGELDDGNGIVIIVDDNKRTFFSDTIHMSVLTANFASLAWSVIHGDNQLHD